MQQSSSPPYSPLAAYDPAAMELARGLLAPSVAAADNTKAFMQAFLQMNPLLRPGLGWIEAGADTCGRLFRDHSINHPDWPFDYEQVWASPFCRLLRVPCKGKKMSGPIIVFTPKSGHRSQLAIETVMDLSERRDVLVTDWVNPRYIPASAGPYALDPHEITHYINIMEQVPGAHAFFICQPCVPGLAAVAVMEESGHPAVPKSIILMNGPVDPGRDETEITRKLRGLGVDWMEANLIHRIPSGPGAGREVTPGDFMLASFVLPNWETHAKAGFENFMNVWKGKTKAVRRHDTFYAEFLRTVPLHGRYSIETGRNFIERRLAKGTLPYKGTPVKLREIRRPRMLTIVGEKDPIAPKAQTEAAHELCSGLPAGQKHHRTVRRGKHYLFSGLRWRRAAMATIEGFIEHCESGGASLHLAPAVDASRFNIIFLQKARVLRQQARKAVFN
jgi:poly(3-hydroxybutyrate) depolymerase